MPDVFLPCLNKDDDDDDDDDDDEAVHTYIAHIREYPLPPPPSG